MKNKPWRWVRSPVGDIFGKHEWVLRDGRGRNRANVYANGTWHTWDEHGTGGENSVCATVQDAMDQALAAVVRQGWTSFQIEYSR